MAGDTKKLQPIIVKRVKKGGHAAHGGAWKIAYADFVTAMMAFFLLMWLLGSTTEGDKKGIADYFNAPLKIAMMGGSGAGDSSSIITGGGRDLSARTGAVRNGDIDAPKKTYNLSDLRAAQQAAEEKSLEHLKQRVQEVINSTPELSGYRNQIRLDMTREGLRIQIVDELNRPMFDSGSAVVQPYMRQILDAIGAILAEVPNKLTIEGHTDAAAFGSGERGYSNWELSADRANASRRELMAAGLPPDKIVRVQGLAASNPFDREDPLNPVNRRISIIVMNRDAEDRFFKPTATDDATAAAGGPAGAAPAQASSPAVIDGLPSSRAPAGR
ncbi:MAG: flagellar motor protein MotB [Aquabacterium sp.]|nr:flagellar motor protein MotB [Aquabacterium sp.]